MRVVLAFLVAILFAVAAASSAPEGRAQLLAEIHRTREEIERRHGGSIERYAEPEYAQEVGRFWALAERWTSEYLDAHPAAPTREIEADLATLANDLRPSAPPLGRVRTWRRSSRMRASRKSRRTTSASACSWTGRSVPAGITASSSF